MISRTGTYALRAALCLARHDGRRPVPAAALAEELRIPADYLAKILHRLKLAGVLEARRGAGGGYLLASEVGDLTVARVIEPFEEERRPGVCLLHNRPCDPSHPCSAHERWSAWTDAARGLLGDTTVAELLGHEPNPAHTSPEP